jgi:glutaredoxin 3
MPMPMGYRADLVLPCAPGIAIAWRVTCSQELAAVSRIEVYTQPWCPYCTRAMTLLSKKGVSFEEINAPHGTPERAASEQRSGRTSVPQIFIDGKHVGGCDDLMALERAGKLDVLLAA